MARHPNTLPDDVMRKLADLAQEHGYGIETLTLLWDTKDLGAPPIASVTYSAARPEPPFRQVRRWRIGDEFTTAQGTKRWRVTDVGTRVVVAIQLEPGADSLRYVGPPYAIAEVVFDEHDLKALEEET